jgi:hypothetical protein
MKVGDLIYDEHYGYGIVYDFYGVPGDRRRRGNGAVIHFFSCDAGRKICHLERHSWHSVEVVCETPQNNP